MDIRKLNDRISVAPQIAIDDIPAIAEQGFKTVICNRPDAETPDQPPLADVEAAVTAAGMTFRHIPIVSGTFPPEQLKAFADAYASDSGPILAYCRSGTRSTCLWAIAEAPQSGADAVMSSARDAGFDIAGIRPLLQG